jgi:hypothetical protein
LAIALACAACSGDASLPRTDDSCSPPCRAGYTCQDGACLVLCNPRCNAGYVCVNRGGETYCVRPAVDAGGPNVVADGAVDAAAEAAAPRDPRPAAERACPRGATLRVRLWDVYATPLRLDDMPWDGLPTDLQALSCRVGSRAATDAVRNYLNTQLPGAGVLFDLFVRDRFREAIAATSQLSADWLQRPYIGPDMFATATESGATIWQTAPVQDRWQASLRTTTRGGPAEWSMACGGSTRSGLAIADEDIAFNDRMGAVSFALEQLTPQMICGGWALLAPYEGIAATVMRIQVDGLGQNCEGLLPTMMEEVTLQPEPPADPMSVSGSVQAGPSAR